MNIKTFKLKGLAKRTESGDVVLILNEDERKLIHEQRIENSEATRIPSIAKELADHNDAQRTFAKGTLLKSQTEGEVFLELKYLMD